MRLGPSLPQPGQGSATRHNSDVASLMVRGVAIAAGLVLGVTVSLGLSPLFAVIPVPLIVGATIQRKSALAGRVLMWVGAFLTSIFAGYLGFAALASVGLLRRYHDLGVLLMFSLSTVSFVLAAACDLMLIIDAVEARHRIA